MIVSRAPVRFSLGGGGSDLPAYASRHGGFVVSAAVDKYVYVIANRRFLDTIRLSYSKTETVERVDDIQHQIFREALRFMKIDRGIELVSMADVPANSGLGSSSAFTVSLLNALHAYRREYVPLGQLAEEACRLEIEQLGQPIGKQDQYASAFGRVVCLHIGKDGHVEVEPLWVSDDAFVELESNLHVFYTGIDREATPVLVDQQRHMKAGGTPEAAMHRIKELGYEVQRVLRRGDVDAFGEIMHAHWIEKRKLSAQVSSSAIDEHYEAARKAGATGGKLMGAGAGGFFLFYCREGKQRLVETMVGRGLKYLRFRFDVEGAKIAANLRRA